jgi:hypothetical protein
VPWLINGGTGDCVALLHACRNKGNHATIREFTSMGWSGQRLI